MIASACGGHVGPRVDTVVLSRVLRVESVSIY